MYLLDCLEAVHAKLHANPHGPALLSLFLTNFLSQANKMAEILLRIISGRMRSCVAFITKTWLVLSDQQAAKP